MKLTVKPMQNKPIRGGTNFVYRRHIINEKNMF